MSRPARPAASPAGASRPSVRGRLRAVPGHRLLRVAVALAVVVAGVDGFLLWGRGLATPVGPELRKLRGESG